MKIVIAPDSFKGSLEAIDVCNILEKAAKDVFSEVTIEKLPVADGGEGTVNSILDALNGEKIVIPVKDALGREINGEYGIFNKDNAVIEMATASGLPLISEEDRDVMKSNTFGTGELILDAIEKGCKTIYLGIGGSATNDGGLGCLAAFGVKFLDGKNEEVEPFPINFKKIEAIDNSNLNPKIKDTNFIIMSDVKNPLLGKTGATYVFGKQKGATEEDQKNLEDGMTHYIGVIEKFINKTIRDIPGTGAAGGLGTGLLAFTNAQMKSGVDTVLEVLEFENKIADANLVVTGEGRMDYQSAFGKVAYGVGVRCKERNIPCVAIVGGLGERYEELYECGIDTIMTTVNGIMNLSEAVENAESLCYGAGVRLFRGISVGTKLAK